MGAAEKANLLCSINIIDRHDHFAAACEALGGSIYHQPGWRAAFDVYGLRTHWLVAQRDGISIGILPLVRQSSRLFGHRLVSLPWVDEAGAIGDYDAVIALLKHAVQLTNECGRKFKAVVKPPVLGKARGELAEWSSAGSQLPDRPKDWSLASGDKVLMRRRLTMSSEELWKDLSPKVRNQVRKAEKSGLTTERGGIELVDNFYRIYARNMRDLGSPSHSLRFFQTLVEALDGWASIYCTRLEGNVIGAGLVFDNRPSLDIPWASSLRAYNRLCVNHALYWKILSDACTAGFEWFHFGRSDIGSGQHKFKKQWGAEEAPLAWLHYSQQHAQQPQSAGLDDFTAPKEKFGLAQRLWTKLPLPVARQLGPLLIRHVQ